MLIPADRIEAAYRGINRVFRGSPHYVSDSLSELAGTTILIKDETRNPIKSFKGRGASWWMSCHPETERVVCASAGNFGQGVAYAGRSAGCEVHVVAAETANPVKIQAMKDFGAEIHITGHDFDAAKEAARALAIQIEGYYLEDGRDIEIAEGAGTIGVELARARQEIDIVFIPVGNGALANGVGSYLKQARPGIRVVGVCAEGAPSMARSWQSGRVVQTESADTIADGIAVRNPIPEALDVLADAIDEMILVSESDIKGAMQLLDRQEGVVTEPAGAVSLAGALSETSEPMDATVAVLICGANIDPVMQKRWLTC